MIGIQALGCGNAGFEPTSETSSALVANSPYLRAELKATAVWEAGYCAELIVTNNHPSVAATMWTVAINLGSATLMSSWNADFSAMDGGIRVTSNSALASRGGTTTAGFCASRADRNQIPVVVASMSELPNETWDEPNLLQNGGFESGSGTTPSGWSFTTYGAASGEWKADCGRNGSGCVEITSVDADGADARWVQEVRGLKPFHAYLLKGYAKGRQLSKVQNPGPEGVVVNISFDNRQERPIFGLASSDLTEFDWEPFRYDAAVNADGTLVPAARVGFTWSMSKGIAAYDDLVLSERTDMRTVVGNHTAITALKRDTFNLTDSAFSGWVANMDTAYHAMQELTGITPRNGATQGFYWPELARSAGACWSSDPIVCNDGGTGQNVAVMSRVAFDRDWGFGPVHELGHVFSEGNFAVQSEMFANWHLWYVVTTRGAYVGTGTALSYWEGQYHATWYPNGTLATDQASADGLMYKWALIEQQTGWEPWKRVYRWMVQNASAIPDDQYARLELWHNKLREYSWVNPATFFTADEINLLKKGIK
jgi:hypothetical protein